VLVGRSLLKNSPICVGLCMIYGKDTWLDAAGGILLADRLVMVWFAV